MEWKGIGNLSGRQRVDTWGQCPAKNLKAFSCSISLRAGDQSVSKTASIPFIVHMPGTVRCRTRTRGCHSHRLNSHSCDHAGQPVYWSRYSFFRILP